MTRDEVLQALAVVAREVAELGGIEPLLLPCDYLVLDLETTGTDCEAGRVVQLGLLFVSNCSVSDELWDGGPKSLTLRWPAEVFDGCEAAIAVHGIGPEESAAGVDPVEALTLVRDVVSYAMGVRDAYLVGHNLCQFDIPFLAKEMERAGMNLLVDMERILDTGALVKAALGGLHPMYEESAVDFFLRVARTPLRRVYWRLEEAAKLLNVEFDPDAAHNAGYDCLIAHQLVLEINKLLGWEA